MKALDILLSYMQLLKLQGKEFELIKLSVWVLFAPIIMHSK